ncbi:PREDICTED: amphiphysin-like isoform X1 [Amphimedon queenslandica]|uniref:SH3 domain-containing protein n=1 Tax=Amphimedon queenslandica TaxID=400682 RepID=A0AAN0IYP2_AMPQE|nr:PREDICTED: amphiphysin-like isoform X1 [Amphimedon queenslandica]|eukprot:XP_019849662.1 PREDICTED: amphiphysin-like isoform X1 [Amphimedon queenslandica]
MAEARGDKGSSKKILSFATKKARRVQQKMLQKVGQAEKTTDDNYTEFVVNFNKQQLAASRLQKELAKYTNNAKVLSHSTKSFMDLWLELYEPEWKGYSEMQSIIEQKMLLWEDLLKKIQNEMMEPLQLYMSKFPETKKLVERRERKIVDYDYAKRELEAARQNKKVTEVKLQQFEDTYHNAKAAFDEVTDKLYDELPTLFDSRIEFYATFFRNMSTIELKFHEEMAKLDESYNETMNQLHEEAESGVHTSRKERVLNSESTLSNLNPVKNSPVDDEASLPSDDAEEEGDNLSEAAASSQGGGDEPGLSRTSSGKDTPTRKHSSNKPPPSKPARSDSTLSDEVLMNKERRESASSSKEKELPLKPEDKDPPPKPEDKDPPPKPEKPPLEEPTDDTKDVSVIEDAPPTNEERGETEEGDKEIEPEVSKEPQDQVEEEGEDNRDEREQQQQETNETQKEEEDKKEDPVPEEGKEDDTPPAPDAPQNDQSPNVLFKVTSRHPYTGEDEDELTFDKGVVIHVIPYDNPDDEEDGWLMGFIPGTTARGIFPENFTERLND